MGTLCRDGYDERGAGHEAEPYKVREVPSGGLSTVTAEDE